MTREQYQTTRKVLEELFYKYQNIFLYGQDDYTEEQQDQALDIASECARIIDILDILN